MKREELQWCVLKWWMVLLFIAFQGRFTAGIAGSVGWKRVRRLCFASTLRPSPMGIFVFHPSVLGGCWTEQPSPECSLLPVQVPSSDFYKNFSKEVQVSQRYSRIAQSIWSSHMVEISDHLLPISKADMWSLWVGRCLHTLVACIAQPKSDPWQDRYLAKFRSHGIFGGYEGMK